MSKHKSESTDYFIAGSGFNPDNPNPFSQDGSYGPKWSAFIIQKDKKDHRALGHGINGLFHYDVWQKSPNLRSRLADYLRYEPTVGRKMILSAPTELNLTAFVKEALTEIPETHVLRSSDVLYLVHSTVTESGEKIIEDGELRSYKCLQAEGFFTESRLGHREIQEPDDYLDHINFAVWTSPWPEAVVSSNQKNRFVTLDEAYTPGYRFYFDAHEIIRSGRAVRTGNGILTVQNQLVLEEFLVTFLTEKDVHKVSDGLWTPRSFTEAANSVFKSQLKVSD